MALDHYGVAIGTLVSFTRDPQHSFGSWYHGHVTLSAGGATWQSALDVDAPASVGVAYRLVTDLSLGDLGPVGTLAAGWHELARTPSSGALDYVRSRPLLDGWAFRWLRRAAVRRQARVAWQPPPADVGQPGGADPAAFPPAPFGPTRVDDLLRQLERWRARPWLRWIETLPLFRWRSFPWIQSSGDNALDALDPHLRAASRVYLFGERYRDGGNGVHDVHMNQGDPAGSRWWGDNAIWQDGGVACQQPDGSVVVWQVRFNTQRVPTDDQGHPGPAAYGRRRKRRSRVARGCAPLAYDRAVRHPQRGRACMHRRFRSVSTLLVVALLAGAVAPLAAAVAADGPQATQSLPRGKDPRGGRGGDRPDPRCRSLEHRLDAAKRSVDAASSALDRAKRTVAAKRVALRAASGRRAKARARRALRRAKAAQRAAQRALGEAQDRLAAWQHQASEMNCS